MKIRPVILSGGSGTRLWPVSRKKLPKQFVRLIGEDSLFSATLKSVADRAVFEAPLIVGNAEHKFLILDTLDQLNIADATVLLEPEGRNTAAAALVAALADTGNGTIHLVRPSDHLIADRAGFLDAMRSALPAALAGCFALFGITPEHPETGYGYILPGGTTDWAGVQKIASFKEKPSAAAALDLIAKNALWNSGIFFYTPETLIAEAEVLAPELLEQCRKALQDGWREARCVILDTAAYKTMKSEPFDRLFLERTAKGTVVSCSIGWSDVGSWQALWHVSKKDGQGNVTHGPAIVQNAVNCYVRSDGPAVAILGARDITVIATKDAVLVAPRAHAQDIRDLVSAVEIHTPGMAQEHTVARRPWGTYESVARGDKFQVKHIVVLPGRSLSLQSHKHRAEHWVVVSGTAKVECDGVEKLVHPNQSVFIPLGAKHRLGNPGKADLHLIEVQSGDYLGEDDIVRYADNYGRAN